MKLVTKNINVSQLHILRNLLETNGIPAVINGENTAHMISPFLMTEPGLWIYFEEQMDEALMLMNDPDYEVINKVDMVEFYELARNITDKPAGSGAVLVHLGITMTISLLALFALIKVLQWLIA